MHGATHAEEGHEEGRQGRLLMPVRYVPMPKAPARAWTSMEIDYGDRPTMTVYEDAREPQDTGLLDAAGVRLFRVNEPEPIGFRGRGDR